MSWTKKKIGEVCFLEKGATGITKAVPGNYPMVTLAAERTSHNEYQFNAKAVIIPLISSTGHGHASMKRIHYQEGKFALGSILCAAIPKDEQELNAKFLFHYLDFYKEKLFVPLMRGAANVSLSMKSIAAVEIPIPSICEQEQIVEKIINTEKEFDLLHSELTHQQHLLTQLRQAILQEAVQGKLVPQHPDDEPASVLLDCIHAEKAKLLQAGKLKKEKTLPPIRPEEVPFALPEGWVWCRLGEISPKIGSGSTPKGGKEVYVNNGIKFFRSQNIYNSELVLDDIAYINSETHQSMNGTMVFPNDVLLNITGGSIGRAALVPSNFDKGNVSQHVCIVRPINGLDSSYLHQVILSPYFQKLIIDSTTGAGREGLPKYNLERFPIPLPPLAEQRRIVARVQQLLGLCGQLEQQVQESRGYAGQLLQAVLQEAFGRGLNVK